MELKKAGMLLLVVLWVVGCSPKPKTKQADERPNIVIIMADDLGYSDLGCYGGEINTPNLDYLATQGMRFTQFYNTSRCCPTRASLLTGLYPHQAGVGRMTFDTGQPGYRGYLTENTVTLAEVLKQAGYSTGMTGKWHVSETIELEKAKHLKWLAHQENFGPFGDTAQYPVARGFDKFYGNIWGVVDYFDPFSLVNGKEQVLTVPANYYHTDAISDSSVAYVQQFARKDNPFFLYIAHTAPHWPIQALPEDIARYENVYKDGWQALREKRYKRMVELGLIDSATAKLPPWMFPKKEWDKNPDAAWDAQAMAVHAAMVERMDQGIGRLIEKLRELGKLDNTLILFLSDNGASSEDPGKYGPGFDRAGSTRAGDAIEFPLVKTKDNLPGPQKVHTGIGTQWAHALNTPFRFWKSKIYEGGIATPMIAHWPAGIASKNTISSEMGHVIDFMATCTDLAGAEYPKEYKGNTITPQQGTSLVPVFKSGDRTDPEYIFWEHFGSKGLRSGKWKLVKLGNEDAWQLFDLDKDRTENDDLAAQFPDVVNSMEAVVASCGKQPEKIADDNFSNPVAPVGATFAAS
jgi:arylsulfatase A-like enzyme